MRSQVEQLVQHAVQLPPLPGVYGHNDPHLLVRQLKGPLEGPHKGGTAHLCDKPHIQVRTIDNGKRTSTAAKGNDSRGPCCHQTKAAGGVRVGQ